MNPSNELKTEFVDMVNEKAKLRKRNAEAKAYIEEVTAKEMHDQTGYFLLFIVVFLLALCFIFGGTI